MRRTVNRSSGLDRDPKDRHAFHPVTVESRRHDSHHSYRLTVERKSASDHRWIAAILLLPCRIAHHCNGSCSVSVILHGESATGIGTDAEHGKIVSRNILCALRLSRLIAASAPDSFETTSRLKGGEFSKSGCVVAESLVFVVGEERPVILQSAIHAAILVVANAVKFTRLRHRQGFQQYGMYQREDCGGRANS